MFLIHEYDAAKRREYYLRTRKLKGRKKGSSLAPAAKSSAAKAKAAAALKAKREARKRELQARVTELKAKLERLQAALKVLTEAAQKRSGVEKNTAEKYEAKKQTRSDPTSKYQSTQKEKAAAKKYYDENKDQSLPEQVKSLTEKIKTIQERIAKLRKTGSVGARNSSTK